MLGTSRGLLAAAAATLILGSVGFPVGLRAVDPGTAAEVSLVRGGSGPGGRDPWGRAWCVRDTGGVNGRVRYSAGPNGLDERGRGDDVAPSPYWYHDGLVLKALSHVDASLLGLGAALLLGAAASRGGRDGGERRVANDVAVAVGGTGVPAAVGAAVLEGALGPALVFEVLVSPFHAYAFALWGVLASLCFGALACRAERARDPTERDGASQEPDGPPSPPWSAGAGVRGRQSHLANRRRVK